MRSCCHPHSNAVRSTRKYIRLCQQDGTNCSCCYLKMPQGFNPTDETTVGWSTIRLCPAPRKTTWYCVREAKSQVSEAGNHLCQNRLVVHVAPCRRNEEGVGEYICILGGLRVLGCSFHYGNTCITRHRPEGVSAQHHFRG